MAQYFKDRIVNPINGEYANYYDAIDANGTKILQNFKIQLKNSIDVGNEGTPLNAGNLNYVSGVNTFPTKANIPVAEGQLVSIDRYGVQPINTQNTLLSSYEVSQISENFDTLVYFIYLADTDTAKKYLMGYKNSSGTFYLKLAYVSSDGSITFGAEVSPLTPTSTTSYIEYSLNSISANCLVYPAYGSLSANNTYLCCIWIDENDAITFSQTKMTAGSYVSSGIDYCSGIVKVAENQCIALGFDSYWASYANLDLFTVNTSDKTISQSYLMLVNTANFAQPNNGSMTTLNSSYGTFVISLTNNSSAITIYGVEANNLYSITNSPGGLRKIPIFGGDNYFDGDSALYQDTTNTKRALRAVTMTSATTGILSEPVQTDLVGNLVLSRLENGDMYVSGFYQDLFDGKYYGAAYKVLSFNPLQVEKIASFKNDVGLDALPTYEYLCIIKPGEKCEMWELYTGLVDSETGLGIIQRTQDETGGVEVNTKSDNILGVALEDSDAEANTVAVQITPKYISGLNVPTGLNKYYVATGQNGAWEELDETGLTFDEINTRKVGYGTGTGLIFNGGGKRI